MKVYVVQEGDWEDRRIVKIFKDKTIAEEYIRRWNFFSYDEMYYTEREVEEDVKIPLPYRALVTVTVEFAGIYDTDVIDINGSKYVLSFEIYNIDEIDEEEEYTISSMEESYGIKVRTLPNNVLYCSERDFQYGSLTFIGVFDIKEDESVVDYERRILSLAQEELEKRN